MTVLERIKKLDDERAKLLEEGTREAKAKADAAIEELNSLGYNYRLVEGESKAKTKTPRKKTDICTICKFATDPSHDGRHKAHRAQDEKKRLTEKELAEYGLKKL